MRRIVAVLLAIFIGFWIVYGLFEPWRHMVNGFAINVIGPAAFGVLNSLYLSIVGSIGIPGLWAIGIIIGVFGGFVIYHYWHRADWSLRRWAASRTSKDLGTTGVTSIPTTPAGATTRPVATTALPPTEEVKPEEKLEEAKQ